MRLMCLSMFLFTQVFGICTKVFQLLVSLRLCCHPMDGLFSDEELFLTQNSFSKERV